MRIEKNILKYFVIVICVLFISPVKSFSQIQQEWTTPTNPTTTTMDWARWYTFSPDGTFEWEPMRFYINDRTKVQFMHTGAYNLDVEYTYNFTQEEQNAGSNISSIGWDLNSDEFTEFVVNSYYGTTYPYRKAFRIFDLFTNATIINFDEASYSYSFNYLFTDIDGDNVLEFVVRREPYPETGNYELLVYSTGIIVPVEGEYSNPKQFKLSQNYPNPFNPKTTIEFSVSAPSFVELIIYNNQGERIKSLINSEMEAGNHTVEWDGTNLFNIRVASGVYYYQLVSNNIQESKKMIMLK